MNSSRSNLQQQQWRAVNGPANNYIQTVIQISLNLFYMSDDAKIAFSIQPIFLSIRQTAVTLLIHDDAELQIPSLNSLLPRYV